MKRELFLPPGYNDLMLQAIREKTQISPGLMYSFHYYDCLQYDLLLQQYGTCISNTIEICEQYKVSNFEIIETLTVMLLQEAKENLSFCSQYSMLLGVLYF